MVIVVLSFSFNFLSYIVLTILDFIVVVCSYFWFFMEKGGLSCSS